MRPSRCVHCGWPVDGARETPIAGARHAVEYPEATEAAGRPVLAHLGCVSVLSFADCDRLIASHMAAGLLPRAA